MKTEQARNLRRTEETMRLARELREKIEIEPTDEEVLRLLQTQQPCLKPSLVAVQMSRGASKRAAERRLRFLRGHGIVEVIPQRDMKTGRLNGGAYNLTALGKQVIFQINMEKAESALQKAAVSKAEAVNELIQESLDKQPLLAAFGLKASPSIWSRIAEWWRKWAWS